jgi:hypothetical protein
MLRLEKQVPTYGISPSDIALADEVRGGGSLGPPPLDSCSSGVHLKEKCSALP